jgi:hypothetical protein
MHQFTPAVSSVGISARATGGKMSRTSGQRVPHPMLTKNNFSVADWNTLRDTPFLVGLATLMAEPSGLGTLKEAFAISLGIYENQSSDIPLIRDLTGRVEMQSAQSSLRERFAASQEKPSKEAIQKLALDQARTAVGVLSGTAGNQEVDAYRKLLYGVAEKVANSSREGGFLGFGGKAVSAAEQSFLDQLQSTIQLELVKKA